MLIGAASAFFDVAGVGCQVITEPDPGTQSSIVAISTGPKNNLLSSFLAPQSDSSTFTVASCRR